MTVADTAFAHLALQPAPPCGWNSYDAFGSSVTERQMLDNARVLRDRLGHLGFDLVTLDYCWSHPDPGPVANPDQGPDLTPRLAMDEHGRLLPAIERFPSAADGQGLKPLGDALHAMGQRFGLHMMRGVPRQAVADACPVLGGEGATARDIAMPEATCNWLDQMVGVDVDHPAGQAYYDSVIALYASWGVDFIKADDLSSNVHIGYAQREIEAIRHAIDKTGRPIVLSLSPGPAPLDRAEHLRAHANLWRMSADFWDEWGKLRAMFDLCADWADQVDRPDGGGWPDCDMIPMGPVSQNGPHGEPRRSRFTADEAQTMLHLWGVFRSPLILGGDLMGYRDEDWDMLTDAGCLEAHREGRRPRRVAQVGEVVVWRSDAADGGARFYGFFNLGSEPVEFTPGVWCAELQNQPMNGIDPSALPSHGSRLVRV
ncbi:MAG: alpha-galactosidase [Planctomycetota bacterium]